MDPARDSAANSGKTRVIVVDDDLYVRTSLSTILNKSAHVNCVATHASGERAVAALAGDRPHVALVDINMPDMDGPSTVRAIHNAAPRVQILALTSLTDEQAAAAMIDAGANGFLAKDLPTPAMINAICAAATGLQVLSGPATRLVATDPYRDRPHLETPERRLLGLVMDGRSNSEIAKAVHLSESTVKYHLNALMAKFQVSNRVTLAVRAAQLGYR
ncbi:response regulator transcription factor [Micropruina sp.]|uniref:response regulator transcription factor n=1 Tax=Micropruina sp. TaxID=2737536 RepID=UPI0039E6892E